jgi:hypothetical protein
VRACHLWVLRSRQVSCESGYHIDKIVYCDIIAVMRISSRVDTTSFDKNSKKQRRNSQRVAVLLFPEPPAAEGFCGNQYVAG